MAINAFVKMECVCFSIDSQYEVIRNIHKNVKQTTITFLENTKYPYSHDDNSYRQVANKGANYITIL